MPVNPANQGFPQGGPNAVNPQVIYNQAPQVQGGFFSSVVPGLMNLTKAADSIHDMISGNPLEEAQADQAKAVAESQRAAAREAEQRSLNTALTTISKASAPQRQRIADGYKQIFPQYADLLDSAATMRGGEMAAFGGARPTAVNTETFFGSQGQTQQSPTPDQAPPPQVPSGQPPQQADPRTAARGTAPTSIPDPRAEAQGASRLPEQVGPQDPRSAQAMQQMKEVQSGMGSPVDTRKEARSQASEQNPQPPVPPTQTQQASQKFESMVPQGPAPEPFIRTPFGPVPTPQRPFVPAEAAAIQEGVKPNDVLPLAEAYSSPTINQAVATAVTPVVPPIQERVNSIGMARVWDSLDRGVEVREEDLILASMDAREAQQHLYTAMGKLGVVHPEAGDLLSVYKLAMFLTTKGKNWKPEWGDLGQFLGKYREDPYMLRVHLELADPLSKNAIELDKAIMTLTGIEHTNQSRVAAANIGLQGKELDARTRVYTKQLEVDSKNWATELQAREWGMKREDAKSDRMMSYLDKKSEELRATDSRINELLTRTASSNMPDSFKVAVARAEATGAVYRTATMELGAIDGRLVQLHAQLKNFPVNAEALQGTAASQMGTNLQAVQTEIKDLQARRQELSRRIDGWTDAGGVQRKGLRAMATEAADALEQDPAVQAALKNPSDPATAEALQIRSQLKTLMDQRGEQVTIKSRLEKPELVYTALSDAARNWTAAPPNWDQFKNYPFPGTGMAIASLVPENQLVDYYAHFISEVRAWQAAGKSGVPLDLAGESENIMDRFAVNPTGTLTYNGWGTNDPLNGQVTYLIREGYLAVASYNKKTNSQKLKLTQKGKVWLRQQQLRGGNPAGTPSWGSGTRAGFSGNTQGPPPSQVNREMPDMTEDPGETPETPDLYDQFDGGEF